MRLAYLLSTLRSLVSCSGDDDMTANCGKGRANARDRFLGGEIAVPCDNYHFTRRNIPEIGFLAVVDWRGARAACVRSRPGFSTRTELRTHDYYTWLLLTHGLPRC